MLDRFRSSETTTFFRVLHRASPGLATLWWALLLLRGTMPALLAVVDRGAWSAPSATARTSPGRSPSSASSSCSPGPRPGAPGGQRHPRCGDRRLAERPADGRRPSRRPGMGHLESPELANDLSMARDFDLGMNGPPLFIAMDFIASGLVLLVSGVPSAAVLFALRLVGAARAARRLGRDPLAAPRERGLEGPQHRRGAAAHRHAATPTTSRSSRPRPRSCGCSGSPTG